MLGFLPTQMGVARNFSATPASASSLRSTGPSLEKGAGEERGTMGRWRGVGGERVWVEILRMDLFLAGSNVTDELITSWTK